MRQPFTLQEVSGTMRGDNVAAASSGAVAFAKGLLGNGSFAPTHTIPNLNDGIYGNGNSWIGDTESSFAGVRFALAQTIGSVAFGRDHTGMFTDRAAGNYLLQDTTVASPDETTADGDWTNIGPVFLANEDANRALRHEYSFAPVAGATAVRIFAPGHGIGSGRAIDELEVYAVPEPASAAMLLAGGVIPFH